MIMRPVWRIENRFGDGPFADTSWACCPDLDFGSPSQIARSDLYCKTPGPRCDIRLHEELASLDWSLNDCNANLLFGMINLDNWYSFGFDEAWPFMVAGGFTLKLYHTPFVAVGDTQCVFDCEMAKCIFETTNINEAMERTNV